MYSISIAKLEKRRSGAYRILSDQQKERLDKMINIRELDISDLVIG